jgi:hypothetical protein
MNNALVVDCNQVAEADLVLDRIYRGGTVGGTPDDPSSNQQPECKIAHMVTW